MNNRGKFFEKLFKLYTHKLGLDEWAVTYSCIDLDGDVAARCTKSWEYNSFHIDISSRIFYEATLEGISRYIMHEFCHGINGGIEGIVGNSYTDAERMIIEKTTKHWEKNMLLLLDKDICSLIKAHRRNYGKQV